MIRHVANDEGTVSLAEAEALVREIERLRAELNKLEARVGHLNTLAHQDPLLPLPNRRSFVRSLEGLIANMKGDDRPAAVLFVDVDGLKAINDTFGHRIGDEALIEIGKLLLASVRKSDCVARMGGDEFGILLDRSDETKAWQMALRIVEKVVGSNFCVDGKCVRLSVAVGVGMLRPGDSPQEVIDRADKEMYRIKAG
jgi:diguanylate cyclase (GGDEF)-like protein